MKRDSSCSTFLPALTRRICDRFYIAVDRPLTCNRLGRRYMHVHLRTRSDRRDVRWKRVKDRWAGYDRRWSSRWRLDR